jgi:hypothetical protein
MKRNSLTTAVVAGIAGVAGFAGLANAVDLNPDGLGQVLIYPYYTVNIGQDTLFSVVNTDPVNGKAVKVRFLEGYNSREVLDFNLYLSPNDVWTAAVTQVSDDGGAQVATTDQSCTDPSVLANSPVAFRSAAYDGTGPVPGDEGPQDITRTREGYIELISMGDIDPTSELAGDVFHVGGVPPNCGGVNDAVASAGIVPPTGGLFGDTDITNVGLGTIYPYNADAIDGFSEIPLYSPSSNLNPSLQDANNPSVATFGVARAFVFEGGGALLTADYANGIDAVSAVFMSDAIYNEYVVGGSFAANSDWIVTFPTKRFYVDKDLYPLNPTSPFVEAFHAPGESNVVVVPSIYDREEDTTVQQGDFSPPVSSQPNSLPFEVNVISFLTDTTAGAPSGVLGSILRPNINPFANAGWLKLDLISGDGGLHVLAGGVTPADVPVTLNGLPVTGYWAINVINANGQPGLLANYGGLFRHRASRSCVGADPACS